MVITEDVVNFCAPQIKEDDSKVLLFTRLINTALLILAVGLAVLLPNLVKIMVNAASVLMILVPSVLVGLFAKKKDEPAVFGSLLCGFGMTIVGFFAVPDMPYILGGVACLFVFLVVRSRHFFLGKSSQL